MDMRVPNSPTKVNKHIIFVMSNYSFNKNFWIFLLMGILYTPLSSCPFFRHRVMNSNQIFVIIVSYFWPISMKYSWVIEWYTVRKTFYRLHSRQRNILVTLSYVIIVIMASVYHKYDLICHHYKKRSHDYKMQVLLWEKFQIFIHNHDFLIHMILNTY